MPTPTRPTGIDEALEIIGLGRGQAGVIAATGLTWSGDAMELSVMAFLLPVLQHEMGVTQRAADSIASVVFAGMLAGALGWGLLSDHFGRRAVWLGTTLLSAVGGVASGLIPGSGPAFLAAFLTARACVGVGLAGTNIGFALAGEFLPATARGRVLVLFELFFTLGSVLEVCLVWLALPTLGWRGVLLLTTVPLWIALALAATVPESPRLDLVRARPNRALRTLLRLASEPRSKSGLVCLVSRTVQGVSEAEGLGMLCARV